MSAYDPDAEQISGHDIQVEPCRLPADLDVVWLPMRRMLLVDRGLTLARRRSIVARELASIDLGHETCVDEHTARAQETAAALLAARELIPLDRLIEALVWSAQPTEIAEALCVDEAAVWDRLTGLVEWERAKIEERARRCAWEISGDGETA